MTEHDAEPRDAEPLMTTQQIAAFFHVGDINAGQWIAKAGLNHVGRRGRYRIDEVRAAILRTAPCLQSELQPAATS